MLPQCFTEQDQFPSALRAKVEKELDRLREDGIIQPVQFSDWAAPIVPVMKGDGNVRCAYLLPSVEYLGHKISAEGLQTSESKVSGIIKAPTPKNVSELRSFLGLVNYYHKFLPHSATMLAPLYTLLKSKQPWS